MCQLVSALGADMMHVQNINPILTNKKQLKTMEILNKRKVTMEEMTEYYASKFPYYEPNKRRVGQFAKQMGYRFTKQMKNRKYSYFYLKEISNDIQHEQGTI